MRAWIPLLAVFAFGCNSRPTDKLAATSASAVASGPVAAMPASAAVPSSAASSGSAPAASKANPSRLAVEGKPMQGIVLRAKVTGKVKHISFPGHKTTILEDGEFMIGFGRDALPKEKLALTFDSGEVLEREFEVEKRTYETDRIDGLPKNQVELDAETKKKMAKSDADIDAVRMKFSPSSCYKEAFQWPLTGRISSRYGQPRVLNGTDAGPHWGIDIVAKVGAPVRAPACGKVVHVEKGVPLAGNVLVLDHGRGLTSTFLHLERFQVKEGDTVKQGDVIATVGMTGRTNGPHLDWRMNLYDIRTDPELLTPPMP